MPDVLADLRDRWHAALSRPLPRPPARVLGPLLAELGHHAEWAALLELPPAERLLGTPPWYAGTAGQQWT